MMLSLSKFCFGRFDGLIKRADLAFAAIGADQLNIRDEVSRSDTRQAELIDSMYSI